MIYLLLTLEKRVESTARRDATSMPEVGEEVLHADAAG
jgi:hypothetical protein